MNVVLLGPNRPDLVHFLQSCNDRVTNTEEKFLVDSDLLQNIEFIISYGYRHILKKELVDKFPGKAINVHISLLPWKGRLKMAKREDYQLRKMVEIDSERVLEWRNSERVRANMYTDHIISQEEHKAWVEEIKHNENLLYLICEFKGRPIGLVSFTALDKYNQKCFWGFYLGETDAPHGSGPSMEFIALEYAFDVLKIRKLCCEVFDFNEKVIKLHKKFFFQEEGRFIRHRIKNGDYHDIVFLSLFKEIWWENKEKIARVVFRN